MKKWHPDQDAKLIAAHGSMSIKDLAALLGVSDGAVRGRVARLGIGKKDDRWPEDHETALRELYQRAGRSGVLGLTDFARSIGRNKANVCRKAKLMGLPVCRNRKTVEERKDRRKYATIEDLRAAMSQRQRDRLRNEGHPRGMLGKKHTPEVIALIAHKSAARWAAMTEAERMAHTNKAIETRKLKGFGSAPNPARGSWKAGWREVGGKRNYYRSRWEANYARYLQWLKDRGAIADWQHEPETFWFEQIKRGVRSYLPDFRVWETNGTSALHEVKGWMCPRSKTTLSRMAKYHPEQKIVLIDGPQYRAIRSKVMGLIEGWEDSARDSHA